MIEFYSESRRGGGTAAVAENVDLVVETVYTTNETDPIVNLYGFVEREHAVSEFVQGAPITLNFLVQNRSNVALNEEYAGKGWFTADWKIVRESDGAVVAQGQTACELPAHWISQVDYVTALNVIDGEAATWKPGAYTATLEVNADRSIVEAYYLNNRPVEARFVVTPSDDWVPEEDPDAPEQPEENQETPRQPEGDPNVPEQPKESTNTSGRPIASDSERPISGNRAAYPAPASRAAAYVLPQTGDESQRNLQAATHMAGAAVALLVIAMALRASERAA